MSIGPIIGRFILTPERLVEKRLGWILTYLHTPHPWLIMMLSLSKTIAEAAIFLFVPLFRLCLTWETFPPNPNDIYQSLQITAVCESNF